MTKKLTMLAMVVGALVAVAVPAVASATESTPDGSYDLSGELSGVFAGGAFVVGPCEVHANVDVEEGTATIDSFQITTPCSTPLPGCHIDEALAIGIPWMAHSEGTEVTVTEAGFANVYAGANCALVGIPTGKPLVATGDVTGAFNNETNCVEFAESGDLRAALGVVPISGEVCDETGKLMVG